MLSVALGRATSRALLNCTRYALLAGHGDKGGACRSILVKEPKLSSWPDSRADPASHDGRIEITARSRPSRWCNFGCGRGPSSGGFGGDV
jgi:hypothetical protein